MTKEQKLGERIKDLREEFEMSQEELASKLGLPRPSVSQIESGHREVNSSELKKLSEIFGFSIDDLVSPSPEKSSTSRPAGKKASFDKEKFKQVLLYLLERCGAKPNVGETVLYKLLYFADFNFYELYEEQLTGASYLKNKYGPTPREFEGVVKEMVKAKEIQKITAEYYGNPQKKYLPLVSADLSKLDARAKEVIDRVIEVLSFMDATTISNYSHDDLPYEVAKDQEIIDYNTVFYRKTPYSLRSYPEE